MKKLFYSLIWFSALGLNYVNAMNVEWKPIDWWLVWDPRPVDESVQSLVGKAIWFLYLVAVVYSLYGWFLILTAWWKEDQVKKWRTVIIQALIGLVVIWLSNSIVKLVVESILWGWTWA